MQLSVQGKQLDVGDALRVHVDDRLRRTLSKYFGDAVDVTVTMGREAHLYRAIISAHVGRGIRVEAQGESDSPYPAFDLACDHLAKRLRRHKRRIRQHHKENGGGFEGVPAQQYILSGDFDDPGQSESEVDELGSGSGDDDAGLDEPMVIAEMSTNVQSLTVSEAVMQMDLANLPALMFRNSAHGGLNMVYRREDGNIGWIDPQGNIAG
ncbi:MAG: ribosome-associated translation inhibitor RaiA [Kiloniellales bacterium]|nr:ribosome-associated translation inhibitor RaiA [Kiloniellales bacterium]